MSNLNDLEVRSEIYRNIYTECLVEVKLDHTQGQNSAICEAYKKIEKTGLKNYLSDVKKASIVFTQSVKSKGASIQEVKLGLKQLLIIASNIDAVEKLYAEIVVTTQK